MSWQVDWTSKVDTAHSTEKREALIIIIITTASDELLLPSMSMKNTQTQSLFSFLCPTF